MQCSLSNLFCNQPHKDIFEPAALRSFLFSYVYLCRPLGENQQKKFSERHLSQSNTLEHAPIKQLG